jgi:aspartate/methionine/tyrosine aminotransferase
MPGSRKLPKHTDFQDNSSDRADCADVAACVDGSVPPKRIARHSIVSAADAPPPATKLPTAWVRRLIGATDYWNMFEHRHGVCESHSMIPEALAGIFKEHYESFAPIQRYLGEEQTAMPMALDTGNGGFNVFPPLREAGACAVAAHQESHYRGAAPESRVRESLLKYIRAEGMVANDLADDPYLVTVGNGSTDLYQRALTRIFRCDSRSLADRGAVIMPVPSYGLFVDQVTITGASVIPVTLDAENDWTLQPDTLEKTIAEGNQQLFEENLSRINFEYESFLRDIQRQGIQAESLPAYIGNNDGVTRDELVRNLDDIFRAYKDFLEESPRHVGRYTLLRLSGFPKMPTVPSVECFVLSNPHNPTGKVYTQDEINALYRVLQQYDVHVIEDVAHWGIRLTDKPIGHFGMSPSVKKLFVIDSASKNLCAPDLRLGWGFVSPDMNKTGRKTHAPEDIQFSQQMSLSLPQRAMIMAATSVSNTNGLHAYLGRNNFDYYCRYRILRALLVGFPEGVLSNPDQNAKALIARKNGGNPITGIPGLEIIREPEGTFFVCVDVSSYLGRYFGDRQLNSSLDFYLALIASVNVHTIPGEGMVYNGKSALLRLSFSLEQNELIQAGLRLQAFFKLLTLAPDACVVATKALKLAILNDVGSIPEILEKEPNLYVLMDVFGGLARMRLLCKRPEDAQALMSYLLRDLDDEFFEWFLTLDAGNIRYFFDSISEEDCQRLCRAVFERGVVDFIDKMLDADVSLFSPRTRNFRLLRNQTLDDFEWIKAALERPDIEMYTCLVRHGVFQYGLSLSPEFLESLPADLRQQLRREVQSLSIPQQLQDIFGLRFKSFLIKRHDQGELLLFSLHSIDGQSTTQLNDLAWALAQRRITCRRLSQPGKQVMIVECDFGALRACDFRSLQDELARQQRINRRIGMFPASGSEVRRGAGTARETAPADVSVDNTDSDNKPLVARLGGG